MNLERLRSIVEHIKEFPEEWDQGVFFPGEVPGCLFCLALRMYAPGNQFDVCDVYEDGKVLLECSDREARYLFRDARTLDDFERVLELGRIPDDE